MQVCIDSLLCSARELLLSGRIISTSVKELVDATISSLFAFVKRVGNLRWRIYGFACDLRQFITVFARATWRSVGD